MNRDQRIETLTKPVKPVDLFHRHTGKSRFSWLDSSEQRNGWGGNSIFASNPVDELLIDSNDLLPSSLEELLNKVEKITASGKMIAIGYISYEAALPWLGITSTQCSALHDNNKEIPLAHFHIYNNSLSYDHKRNLFTNQKMAEELCDTSLQLTDNILEISDPNKDVIDCTPLMSKEKYLESLDRIKWHIREGDIYQANLTCGFEFKSPISPMKVYNRLRKLNPAAYSAYLDFGSYQILSSSPERMFLKEGRRISSSPIKGTIERGDNNLEDGKNVELLLNSEKNKSELLMIVDLVRNDLGRVANAGTVRVENLFRAEIYSSLIHLIADISAELEGTTTLCDIFKAILPGGSITGAPKKRAVEIINELETTRRNTYTGVIGYIQGDRADFNIAIRTMTHCNGKYYVNAGGGIVADSDPVDEYNEMLLKAKYLIRAITNENYPNYR